MQKFKMLTADSYFEKATMWTKLNTSASWKWFVEGQCVTSAKGISSLFEGLHPQTKIPTHIKSQGKGYN